jgi:diguanylate cyclase (GGDEF)-like protein/PAS domain S-box-containing protein
MILFCEECGQRNSIDLTPSLIEGNSFTCQFCKFKSPFPFLDSDGNSTSSTGRTSPGSWDPDAVHLIINGSGDERTSQLTFSLPQVNNPELQAKPVKKLENLISVQKAGVSSFVVSIKQKTRGEDLLKDYSGPGLIFCEASSMSWGTVHVTLKHKTVATPAEIAEQAATGSDSGKSGQLDILRSQLLESKNQLLQIRNTSNRLQKELSIRRQVMDNQPSGILFTNQQLQILYANNVFCEMSGHSLKDLHAVKIEQILSFPDPKQNLEDILQETRTLGQWQGTVLLENNGKEAVTMCLSYSFGGHEGKEEGFVCRFPLDSEPSSPGSTENKTAADSLGSYASHEQVTFDTMTGLADRPSFQHQLAACIQEAKKKSSHFALLYVDLDHFKRINQIFGPGFGDKVLCSVAVILQKCSEEAGADFVARLSGDEFAVILPPPASDEQARALADGIMKKFRDPVTNESRAILITPSIGISIFPADGSNPLELLRNADTAMEEAKISGGNGICQWNDKMKTLAVENLYLENDLRKAVAKDELVNYYQPQIDLTNGKIIGMEALARWIHPVQGLISPAAFIPIAENTGLIEKLGIDLVRQACIQGKKWQDMGFSKFIMAVNLSGRLLRCEDLFEQIMSCIEETSFPAESLEVEFTEGVLIENMEFTANLIDKLRKEGINMAIDDFGTGYSSLSYLQHLKVGKIKIDRSFIMNVTTNNTDAAITLGIIAIAKKLNFKVIAEGIETEDHLYFLQKHKCDEGQGFLFSKPITDKEMTGLLLRDSSVALNHKRMIEKFYSILAKDN